DRGCRSWIRLHRASPRRVVAARPRAPVRDEGGRGVPWRAGARPDTLYEAGRGLGKPCDADRRPLSRRRGDAPRARHSGRAGVACGPAPSLPAPEAERELMTEFRPTATTYQAGSKTLPGSYY